MTDTARHLAKTLGKNTPRSGDFLIEPWRLESLLTRTLLPSVGLHAALVSTLLLYDTRWFGYLLPILLLCLVGAILNLAIRGVSSNEVFASRQTNAIFGFGVTSIFAAMTLAGRMIVSQDQILTFAVLLLLGYVVVALMCWRGWIQPLSLVVIGIYTAAFFEVFQFRSNFTQVIIFTVLCFAIGAVVVFLKRRLGYMFGFVIGAAVIIVMNLDGNLEASSSVLAGFAALSLGALVIHELATSKSGKSELASFTAQGFGVAIVVFAAAILTDDFMGTTATVAVVFLIYTLLLAARQGRTGLPIRLLWLIILTWALLWSMIDELRLENDRQLYRLTQVAVLHAMLALSILAKNGFIRLVAIANAFFFLMMDFDRFSDDLDAIVWANIDNISDPIVPIANPDFSGFVPVTALYLLYLVLTLLVALAPRPAPGRPWWQGILRPRYAASIRNIYRTLKGKISNAPIIGWIWALGGTLYTWARYLKGPNDPIGVRDLLDVAIFATGALATVELLGALAKSSPMVGALPDGTDQALLLAFMIGWATWGLILGTRGRLSGSVFHILVGFAFLLIPIAYELSTGNLITNVQPNWAYRMIALFTAAPIFLLSLVPGASNSHS